MRKAAASLAAKCLVAFVMASGALAQDEDYIWSSGVHDGNAFLAYAMPESDDIVLVLSCLNDEGRNELTLYEEIEGVDLGEPVTIEFAQADQTHSLDGIAATDGMSGYIFPRSEAFAVKPLIVLLGEPGEIHVSMRGASRSLPETGREQAVGSFAEACKLD
jgi:hypothetical protein